jgi:predicted ATPase/DNA-binding XRE family transcriptional regulator
MIDERAESFAEVLRDLRVAAGLSQEALAERANLSVDSISALERGVRRAPYRKTVELLAAALSLAKGDRDRFDRTISRTRKPRSDVVPPAYRLPSYGTTFFGRDDDAESLRDLLATSRLITICGPGGVGKTRLAIEIARTFSINDRQIRFVHLASLRDPRLVIASIAAAFGVGEFAGPHSTELLVTAIAMREALVVIDNCEHLIDSVASAVESIVALCPGVDLIATSRRPLLVDGEVLYRLAPLEIESATALFLDRARDPSARRPPPVDAARATRITRSLDGIPFALELAAAIVRTGHLAASDDFEHPTALLGRGERRTEIEHHRSLEATIAWSVDALEASDRVAIVALAFPVAGVSIEAARALVGEDAMQIVARLCDVSLAFVDDRERIRLHETTREYLLAGAREDETARIANRFSDWLLTALHEATMVSWRNASYASYGPLVAELDNLRALVPRIVAARDRRRAVLLATSADYWTAVARMPEGYRLYSALRVAFSEDNGSSGDALFAFAEAMCAIQSGMGPQAVAPAELAAEIALRTGDERVFARANIILGHVALAMGRLSDAADRFTTAASVFDTPAFRPWRERVLYFLTIVAVERDCIDEAEGYVAEIVRSRVERSQPVDVGDDALLAIVRAGIARARGLPHEESARATEARALLDGLRSTMFARAALHLVDALRDCHAYASAIDVAKTEVADLAERGFTSDVALMVERCAAIAFDLGDETRGVALAAFGDAALRETGRGRMRFDRLVRDALDARLGRTAGSASLAIARTVDEVIHDFDALAVLARQRESDATADSSDDNARS